MEETLQKIYLTYYSLLIAQDLWQAHYQTLSTTFSDFLPNFIRFFKNFSSFIKKDIHLVLSKSFLYALIFGKNMHKGLIILASL